MSPAKRIPLGWRIWRAAPLILAAVVLLGLVITYQQSQQLWLRGFEDQEKLQAELQIDQVWRAHAGHLRELSTVVADYALWDDTLAFVHGRYPDYPSDALDGGALANLGIDDLLFLRPDAAVVFSGSNDGSGNYVRQLPDPQLLNYAQEIVRARPSWVPEDAVSEVVRLDSGIAIVTLRPVFANFGKGKVAGLMVAAKPLNATTLGEYSRFSPYPLAFTPIEQAQGEALPAAVRAWTQRRDDRRQSLAVLESRGQVAGYALLRDRSGQVAWILKVTIPRISFLQSQAGLERLSWLAGAAMLVLLGVSIWFGLGAHRSRRLSDASDRRYRVVIEQAADGVMISRLSDGRILEMNPALRTRLGIPLDTSPSLQVAEIFGGEPPPDPGERKLVESRYRALDGRWRDADVSRSVITFGDTPAVAWSLHDTTERHEAERAMAANQDRLARLAHEDMLTGLPNRRYLSKYLQDALAQVRPGDAGFAVLFIDVDRFKNINDTLGHEVGDAFLCRISARLAAQLRSFDLLVRSGGDEFVVVARQIRQAHEASDVAERLLQSLAEPLEVNGRPLTTTASIGIAVCPEHATDAANLLKFADTAMYEAKSGGRNRWAMFDARMHARVHERHFYESELRTALARGDLTVHYQPIVSVDAQRIIAFEALARWQHPELGWISPSQFIPVAEDTALITEVGKSVLDVTLRDMRRWRDQGLPPLPVSVNVSAIQLESTDFDRDTLDALQSHSIAPEELILELTESALLRFGGYRSIALQNLRERGVRIAVDDFGTGYSSLSYLKNLQVDSLKIDRGFIAHMGQGLGDTAIVRAVMAMASELNLRVVAEGVETEHQLKILRELGCPAAQGYLFGKPMPADECAQLMRHIAPRETSELSTAYAG